MTTNNLPATTAQRPADIVRKMLNDSHAQIAIALPKHLTPERQIRMAMTMFQQTPKLQLCTPLSIIAGVIEASQLGLELSGPLGHAYLVPYGSDTKGYRAGFQIGYRGYIELAFRSGKVSAFPMRIVYANDEIIIEQGTKNKLVHRPALTDRGEPIGYYAAVLFKDGSKDFEFMTREDVAKHRDRYSRAKGPDSPWATAFDQMALKTCVRRLAKRVPISAEMNRAIEIEEDRDRGRVAVEHVEPADMSIPVGRIDMALPAPECETFPDDFDPDFQDSAKPGGDLTRDDLMRNLEDDLRLKATSLKELEEIGEAMMAYREEMGEERYGRLLFIYQQRYKALGPKSAK